MTTLSPDRVWELKVAAIRYAQQHGIRPEPGTRAWMPGPNGGLVKVKTVGEAFRATLADVQRDLHLKPTGILDAPIRAYLDKSGLVPDTPAGKAEQHAPPRDFPRPRVALDMSEFSDEAHGHAPKRIIVLHQTISPDAPGLSDMRSVQMYLDHEDYGIHFLTDRDGNLGAVPPALETAVFWHVKGANLEAIGIEQVSYKTGEPGYWWKRAEQLHLAATLCAYLCERHNIPPAYDPTARHGICGHWDVTRARGIAGGHTDCQYPDYPTRWVANAAASYAKAA